MKAPRINAESTYYDPTAKGPSWAAADARDAEYPFFVWGMKVYMIGYWRNDPGSDFFELEIDEEDVQKLVDEITEEEMRLNGTGTD